MKRIKKGFSLVELVIVIAIIAILSGVGVATYISVTNSAKKSVDQQNISQINTCLAVHEATSGGDKPKTMHEAVNILREELGVSSIDKFLTNSFPSYSYAWDITQNRFVILENENIVYKESTYPSSREYIGNEEDFWRMVSSIDADAQYSQYLLETSVDVPNEFTIKSGFDTGNYHNISVINYVGQGPRCKNIIIRTNSDSIVLNATVFVDGTNCDVIKHYDYCNKVHVINGGMNSYHEFGEIESEFVINAGHAVIEHAANIKSHKIVAISNGTDRIKIDYRNDNKNYSIVDENGEKIFVSDNPEALISGGIINNNNQKIGTIESCSHIFVDDIVAPTCTEKGYISHTCTKCGYSYVDNYADALGHDYQFSEIVWDQNSYTAKAIYKCSHNVLHVEKHECEVTSSITKSPTCSKTGIREYVATYDGHSATKEEVLPVVSENHNLQHHDGKAATCTEKGWKAYETCSECGYTTYEEIPALGHDLPSEWTIDLEATCTTAGSKSHHCKRCGEKIDVTEIAASGHKYGDVSYTWNSDNSKCVAKRSCQVSGCTHEESESGVITSAITQQRTNSLPEITTYKATFTNSAFTTQNKSVETAEAIVTKVANCTYDQMNDKAKNFINEVTYDPNDTTTSSISTYNYSPYTGDEPVSGKVNLLAGNLTVTDGGTNISYSEKVSAGDYDFYNLTPNVDSSYVVKDDNGNTLQKGTLHPTGSLRMIKFSDTTFNIRDIGGWNCDGGTINYNKVIRGSQVDNSHSYPGISFTEAEYNRYFKILNIKDEIDLRVFGGDHGPVPTVSYFGSNVDYHQFTAVAYYQGTAQSNSAYTETWRSIISLIASDLSQNKPIYLHCSEGADRTGTIMFLLEAICGVSESDLDKDYELTTLRSGPAGQRVRTYEPYLSMKQYFKKFYGDTLRDKVVNYMLAIGVTIDEINTIRNALIKSTSSTTIEQHNFFDKNAVVTADYAATHKDTVDCRTNAIIKGRVSSGSLRIEAGGKTTVDGKDYYQILSALIPCSAGDKIIISSNYPIKNNCTYSGQISFFANDCSDERLKAWDATTANVYTKANGATGGAISISGLVKNETKEIEYTVPNYSDVKSFRVSIGIDGNAIDTEEIQIFVLQKGIKS